MKDFSQAYFWQKKNPLIYGCSLLAFRSPILHSSARRKLIAILLQLSKLNASFKLSGLESPIVTLFKVKTFNSFPTLHLSNTSFTFNFFFFRIFLEIFSVKFFLGFSFYILLFYSAFFFCFFFLLFHFSFIYNFWVIFFLYFLSFYSFTFRYIFFPFPLRIFNHYELFLTSVAIKSLLSSHVFL